MVMAARRKITGKSVISLFKHILKVLLRIFVLERGRVAECGSHSELLSLQGIYHNLWHRSTTG